jgi:hypothetical protein
MRNFSSSSFFSVGIHYRYRYLDAVQGQDTMFRDDMSKGRNVGDFSFGDKLSLHPKNSIPNTSLPNFMKSRFSKRCTVADVINRYR